MTDQTVEIKAPTSWAEVTLGRYIAYNTTPSMEWVKRLGALCGLTEDQLRDVPASELYEAVNTVAQFVNVEPREQSHQVVVNGKVVVEVPMDFAYLKFGQTLDLDNTSAQAGDNIVPVIPKLLAIASIGRGKYTADEMTERTQMMEALPMEAVWPLINFISSASEPSESASPASIDVTLMLAKKGLLERIQQDRAAAGKMSWFKRSVAETYYDWMVSYLSKPGRCFGGLTS